MGLKWEFFINLSAQDFPLKSQSYIHNFLGHHVGKDFLKVADQRRVRPDTMHRLEDYFTESGDDVFNECPNRRLYVSCERVQTQFCGQSQCLVSESIADGRAHCTRLAKLIVGLERILLARIVPECTKASRNGEFIGHVATPDSQ